MKFHFHFDRDAVAAEIRQQVNAGIAAGDFDPQVDAFMADEVVAAWQANSPEDSGDYKDSVMVKHPSKNGRGAVGTSIGYAHIVEYGSVDTPEYSPRAKAAASFNNGSTGDYNGKKRR